MSSAPQTCFENKGERGAAKFRFHRVQIEYNYIMESPYLYEDIGGVSMCSTPSKKNKRRGNIAKYASDI